MVATLCEQCNLNPLRTGKRFCSPICRGAAGVTGFRKGNTINVGKTYSLARRKSISHANSGPRVSVECVHCKTWFVVRLFQARITSSRPKRFCGRSCARTYNSGDRHYGWAGGVSTLREQIRNSIPYRQWRLAIFRRDEFACVLCGRSKEVNGTLEADHHPISHAEIVHRNKISTLEHYFACAEMWDINNGRTLCHDCHTRTETYGGRNIRIVRAAGYISNY